MRLRKHILILALCSLSSASCERDKAVQNVPDGGGDPVVRDGGDGMDGGAVITNLGFEERQKLCAEAKASAQNQLSKTEFQQAVCRFTGFFAAVASGGTTSAQVQSACREEFDSCLTEKLVPPTAVACAVPITCDISAAELQTCIIEWAIALQASYAAFPACETLSIEALEKQGPSNGADVATPIVCASALAKCPGLFQ